MESLKLSALLLVLLVSSSSVSGQTDCSQIVITELGDTAAPSGNGLLADALRATGAVNVLVQILRINIVCEAQGSVRDLYRSTSVVVEYTDGATTTVQVECQCLGGMWGLASPVTMNPVADLTTPKRRDCILCADPFLSTGPIFLDSHCLGRLVNNLNLCPGPEQEFTTKV